MGFGGNGSMGQWVFGPMTLFRTVRRRPNDPLPERSFSDQWVFGPMGSRSIEFSAFRLSGPQPSDQRAVGPMGFRTNDTISEQ